MLKRRLVPVFALIVAVVATASAPRAMAHHHNISGYVTDGVSGAPLEDVCITVGPPIVCYTRTNAEGFYFVDLAAVAAPHGQNWNMWFLRETTHQRVYSESFKVSGPTRFNQTMMPIGARPACPTPSAAQPTLTTYLPNVTKTLGAADGWQTPFIVQNTGSVATQLEITFFRFINGQCVTRRTVNSLAPGTSFADVPNADNDLPGDTQFAVVIRSFGAPVVAVVNQHAGTGDRAEALAYTGATRGERSVFLPNITRRFFGYYTPFIIQNLGAVRADVVARFVSFDGSAPQVTVFRQIDPGTSKYVDPNSDDPDLGAAGLVDGKQYSATVTGSEPVSVVVNTHNDAPGTTAPLAYSTNGILFGAHTIHGAYAAKNAGGIGRVTTIVVQNMGVQAITPSLHFLPFGVTGAPQRFTSPKPVPPGAAWAFDPRVTLGTTDFCNEASATCLGDGEYTFVATSNNDEPIAAQVNVISPLTAMGYTATALPAAKLFLPNVTRTLCGCADPGTFKGWTTPIMLQAVTASAVDLSWYRFADGQLVHRHRVAIPARSGVIVDPRAVSQLSENTQYAVVVEGVGGLANAVVVEIAPGGDNAMIYEGFPDSLASPLPGPTAAPTPDPTSAPVPTPTPGPGTPQPFPTLPPVPTPQ